MFIPFIYIIHSSNVNVCIVCEPSNNSFTSSSVSWLEISFHKVNTQCDKTMRRGIVDVCLCSSGGWWLWGEEEQDIKQEDANPFPAEVVDPSADQEKDSNLDEITEIKSPSEVEQFNRESFEQKLEEVIKAHESHHLSKESHLEHLDGDHDQDFDHKAFLGEEAEEFRELTPEESKERLKPIVVKIDMNNDTVIGVI